MPARQLAGSERWPSAAMSPLAVLLFACLALTARPVGAQESLQVDRVVVLKRERLLELWHEGEVIRSYPIDLGRNPVGPKHWQGDNRTPEGIYRIDRHQAASRFRLALHISYPSETDIARAREQRRDPGGAIFIHGLPAGFGWADPAHFPVDWTAGCIAVSNHAIDEIWRLVSDGTTVEIRP